MQYIVFNQVEPACDLLQVLIELAGGEKLPQNMIFCIVSNNIYISVFYAKTYMKLCRQSTESKKKWFQSDLCNC